MPGTRAVLAFRDDTRVTLGSNSRFRVDNFVYDESNPGEGRFLATLLRGSVRALTGLIAKANNRNANFATPTATIGIRGTGWDGDCVDSSCSQVTLWVWLGAIVVTQQSTTEAQMVQAGQGVVVFPQGFQPVLTPPSMDSPRPDSVEVPRKLFGTQEGVSDTSEGLFVLVRDGHIEIATANDVLQLGRGEAGFVDTNGQTVRPPSIPKFLDYDRLPMPTSKNPLLVNVLADSGIKNQCK
jgi:hypothetical protein